MLALINRDRPTPLVIEPGKPVMDLGSLITHADGPMWPVHADTAGNRLLIRVFRDSGPSSYYLVDQAARTQRYIGDDRPCLRAHSLSSMEPFTFTATDGLQVHGYLTYPRQLPRRELPAVLVVHGGPWDRNNWGFDPEAQWIADLGYLCVQVNFRGSTGYGKDFVNAGDREWGGLMHRDLLDAIDHLVRAALVDASRVAILGASYGGYAALVGAALTPERFTCAVDAFGPSNLVSLLRSLPAYWAPTIKFWHQRVGDPDADRAFLEQRSPLFHAAGIGIPLFVAQGLNDPRVKAQESEQVVAAARAAGVPVQYQSFADEGHGFNRPENRLAFYRSVEGFLKRHLPSHSDMHEIEQEGLLR